MDVSFQYPNDDEKVLRKINLEIHQGTSLGIDWNDWCRKDFVNPTGAKNIRFD